MSEFVSPWPKDDFRGIRWKKANGKLYIQIKWGKKKWWCPFDNFNKRDSDNESNKSSSSNNSSSSEESENCPCEENFKALNEKLEDLDDHIRNISEKIPEGSMDEIIEKIDNIQPQDNTKLETKINDI